MPFALKLTHDEPRLVYLALTYHLARPGSELDPDTRLPAPHGLREVRRALANQLTGDSAVIELDEPQFRRLLSAIYGSVNELRVQHMQGGASGAVAGFADTARQLFPALVADPDEALALSEAMMMLHRRMERAVRAAAEAPAPAGASGVNRPTQPVRADERRRRWPFRR